MINVNEKKVMLIDDHSIVRVGIRTLIDKQSDLFVCAEAGSLKEAYEQALSSKPDIILLDLKLPDGDGIMGCRELKRLIPAVKIVILTAFGEESLISEVIRAGADGYLLKNIDGKKIIQSIRDVLAGHSILDDKIGGKVIDLIKKSDKKVNDLTKQEESILALVSEGKTNKEIAKELFIADKTVRNYVSKILRKINVDNRTEAALYWIRYQSYR